MDPIALDLDVLADHLLAQAAENPQRRAAQRIDLDHQQLRMTAIGFDTGGELPEHTNPGEAVLQVVRGRIRLSDATRTIDVAAGTVARIPDGVHRVEALEPSVMLLTALPLPGRDEHASAESRRA
jgi:quercetin dioxygenase-like cupin family protein